MQENIDTLGSPQISLAGLQVWVHGRQFPEANDFWDGNWINVTAHCGADRADVWVTGPIIHLSEIAAWADACEHLATTLRGTAQLACMEPGLSLAMTMQNRGHISTVVQITPDHLNQKHTFEFEIDQTYLHGLVLECRQVLETYPIKNEQ